MGAGTQHSNRAAIASSNSGDVGVVNKLAKRQNWQLTFSGLCYAPCLRRPACRPQCRPKRNMLLEACAAAVEGQLAEVGARAEVGPTGARLCSCCRSDFKVEVIYTRQSLRWGARLPACPPALHA